MDYQFPYKAAINWHQKIQRWKAQKNHQNLPTPAYQFLTNDGVFGIVHRLNVTKVNAYQQGEWRSDKTHLIRKNAVLNHYALH